jgi:hypothetical protein
MKEKGLANCYIAALGIPKDSEDGECGSRAMALSKPTLPIAVCVHCVCMFVCMFVACLWLE